MNDSDIWLVIAGLTLVTVITRSFFLVLGDRLTLPARVQHALRYAPACALAALIAPEVLLAQGTLSIGVGNLKLLAAAVAVATMIATRSMIVAMAVGMAAYTALRTLA